jgi:hypothetical protein
MKPTLIKLEVVMVTEDTVFQRMEYKVHEGDLRWTYAGYTVMAHGVYQLFGAALGMGAEKTRGHLSVQFDDKKWLAWTEEQARKEKEAERGVE